ncbi:uncharacterized protein PV09_06839 [Verruconis gallopava]|uniref:Zn(2)-C6 fungal-type domain-containing protein n=1 Tax=Verruconis gallopava TaxID=253628 RepID=A0A0D2AR28_9PEZI|nr:uncharacterized protein PV09_06839 [Verruconis gallopava]KIW01654.1 hypothetical protein PV09_06839 [Verruconis gallopava]
MSPPERSSSVAVEDGGIRKKKMRKGTHSCFECRRRKIRCIFTPDNPSVCTECFARGSRCIDQESADPDIIVDHRKNLRERVARLEALIETLVEDKSEKHAAEALRSLGTAGHLPPTPISEEAPSDNGSARVPVMTLFDNAVLSRTPTTNSGSISAPTPLGKGAPTTIQNGASLNYTSPHVDGINAAGAPGRVKSERTRQALMSILPSYSKLLSILKSDHHTWAMFQRKCPGTRGNATIEEFTARVMARGSPCELGLLVLLYGKCEEGDLLDQCTALVDRWILSDDEYMGTLEGLECVILMGKIYSDIGQARKSWLAFRRGLTFAQLMGLHRNHSMSIPHESIWWSLYGADRLTSLMLGMPYGIPDSHCNMSHLPSDDPAVMGFMQFFTKISYFAGKVIDRSQGMSESSYSSALDLEQELNDYAAQMPQEFWQVQPLVDCEDANIAYGWQEQLLGQIAFHQIKAYLHMPFMLKAPNQPGYEPSRRACIDGSREILRIYHMLRAEGTPLYECKAIDFIAFTACILLVLGVLGYGRTANHDPKADERDWVLIEHSMEIFRRASSEKGGKVAAQSYQALEQLHQLKNDDSNTVPTEANTTTKIVIPFFGTISVQRGQNYRHNTAASTTQNTPQSQAMTTPATPDYNKVHDQSSATYSSMDPQVMFDGLYQFPSSFGQQQSSSLDPQLTSGAAGDDSIAGFGSSNTGMVWPNNWGTMDLDQDWSWLMTDNVAAGSSSFGMP